MNKEISYKQNSEIPDDEEMLGEYDFSKGVRGKHYLVNLSSNHHPVVVKTKSEDGDRYITTRIIEVQAVITPDGKLTAQLPLDVIPGEHRVVLRIEQPVDLPTVEISAEKH